MVVFLHVVVALLSMVLATLCFFNPSKARLAVTYGLIIGTIASGIYLVWMMPSRMMHVCIAGLVYIVITGAITFAARARLMAAKKDSIKL